MSIIMNNYEKNLMNKLQKDMSKKDAEDAIIDIRFGIYKDYYHKISPIHYCDNHGNIIKESYPNPNDLISAYYSDDYSDFRKR